MTMTHEQSSDLTWNPIQALNKAIIKIPQLKYALGLMGIAAVVYTVLTWIADRRIAVFGIVITIALMYVLAIFAQSIGSKPGNKQLAGLLTWSVSILFITILVLLISSYAFGIPSTLSNRLFGFDNSSNKSAVTTPESELVSLSGSVVDERDNKPLPRAKVTLDDIPGMAAVETSTDGVFNLNKIPKKHGDTVRIRVILEGYHPNPYTEDVVIGKSPPLIKLRRAK